jgi:hypothetical protein
MDTKCSQVVWTLAEHMESPPVGQSNRAERELLTLLGRQDVSARAGRARAQQASCGGEDMPAAPCGVRKRAALCGVVKCEAALCVVIELCCPAAYNLSVCASVGFHLSFYRRFPPTFPSFCIWCYKRSSTIHPPGFECFACITPCTPSPRCGLVGTWARSIHANFSTVPEPGDAPLASGPGCPCWPCDDHLIPAVLRGCRMSHTFSPRDGLAQRGEPGDPCRVIASPVWSPDVIDEMWPAGVE